MTSERDSIRSAMDGVSHAIFILGAVYDEFTAEQIEAAQELGKPVAFWVRPGSGQRDMLKRIEGLAELPAGSEILGGRSIREMIPQLLAKLKPRETIEPAAPSSGIARVYLNYETKLPEDARIAARVADVVCDRKLEVVRNVRDGDHERLMRSANAVLVIRAAHAYPDEWLKLNAMELALSGQIYEKNPDFAAKALLVVTEPARIRAQAAGVPIYSWTEQFPPETLNPFFDKLQAARSADAGR